MKIYFQSLKIYFHDVKINFHVMKISFVSRHGDFCNGFGVYFSLVAPTIVILLRGTQNHNRTLKIYNPTFKIYNFTREFFQNLQKVFQNSQNLSWRLLWPWPVKDNSVTLCRIMRSFCTQSPEATATTTTILITTYNQLL